MVSLGLLTATGCWNPFSSDKGDDDNGGGPPDIDRTSPDRLLNYFAYAYENQEIDRYDEAIDDYFEFEFTPDVADTLGLPEETPWWGKVEDRQSTLNMFNAEEVKSVEFHLTETGVNAPWEDCGRWFLIGDPPESTFIMGLCKEFEPDIKVTIEEAVEPRILWVNTSLLDIMVRPDPNDPELWTILRIREALKPSS